MKHIWTLTAARMRLAVRNRAFIFFSLMMPLAFEFVFLGIFGKGDPAAVSYLFGPVLALTVMGSFWGLSIQLVLFREQGILRRFRLAPIGAAEMLASSIVSNYVLTLPTIVIEFALGRGIFHLAHWGNLWGVWVFVTLGSITFAAFGLIVASVTNTMQETQVINNAIWFAFLFLSGATFPLPLLPSWVQRFSVFLPPTYLVTGLQRVMVRDAALWQVGAELLALAGGSVAAFLISTQLFRWEPEEKVTRRAKAWAAATVIPFVLLGVWESAHGQLRNDAKTILNTIERREAPRPPQP
ncbi:MAG TPA: ABC transporter permease [Candidatus Acidoferrales bacterium]|nr:ABC transporter permease [Candidatus Acidoferrales bacterium]